MGTGVQSNRPAQVLAWIAGILFVAGFFFKLVGQWTQPMLALWFAGTQKPLRGFVWLLAFGFLPAVAFNWRPVSPSQGFESLAWLLAVAVLNVLPITFHRLTSPQLPGLMATLPFPLAAAAILLLQTSLPPSSATIGNTHFGVGRFFILWVAALLVWLWARESPAITPVACVTLLLAGSLGLLVHLHLLPAFDVAETGSLMAWTCALGITSVALVAGLRPSRTLSWERRTEAVSLLRSPLSGDPLHVEGGFSRGLPFFRDEEHGEALVSSSGERFPIRNGIPVFLQAQDLTGDNGKYNHLYETIGGFYDDTQRVFVAFRGLDLDSYFENYMNLLEAKPGDRVLETSVGTGLNFKYLPHGVKLSGLDLSSEMLANCQSNLRRWGMEADLYLGNAERLPFADNSFDVVYTAGAFNFFSDRARALAEMIRVAKPGSLLMVEDETEKYVQSTYEKIPGSGQLYKDRKQPVTIPIDLIPKEMEDVQLHMLKDDKFYAITFRKPGVGE